MSAGEENFIFQLEKSLSAMEKQASLRDGINFAEQRRAQKA
jgi:hypothetical protein